MAAAKAPVPRGAMVGPAPLLLVVAALPPAVLVAEPVGWAVPVPVAEVLLLSPATSLGGLIDAHKSPIVLLHCSWASWAPGAPWAAVKHLSFSAMQICHGTV